MAQADTRPISPHLQVWRWHITMLTSILMRATGVALYGGALGLAAWLCALAIGPEAFAVVDGLAASLIGQIVIYASVAALGFHLGQGLRHLVWDTGTGLRPGLTSATAWLPLLAGLLAPAGLWALLLARG